MKMIQKLGLTAITVCAFTYANDPGHVFHFKNENATVTYSASAQSHVPMFNPSAILDTSHVDDLRHTPTEAHGPAAFPHSEACWIEPDGEPMAGPTDLMPPNSRMVPCTDLPGWYTDDDGQA